MTSPQVTPRILAGSACPPDIRRTAAFRRIPRERKPILLTHQTRQYCESLRGTAVAQVEIFRNPVVDVENDAPPTNLTSHADQVISYLKSKGGAVSKGELGAVLPRSCSLRDVLYRLKRAGRVVEGKGGFVLGGGN